MAARKKNPRKPVERNLTRELSALLAKRVLPDLTERAQEASVRAALLVQFDKEKKDERTADKVEEWAARTLEQVAVAWILSCVFIRTLEDRGYLTHRRLGGEGAADSEQLFFDLFPSLTQRDYLFSVFRELSRMPGGGDVLGPKRNPAWRLAPSPAVVRELLGFFREVNGEGALVWRFEGTSTRFLGDLYQGISENVRERYALLQTPEFVEEFILDQTLEPAIQEFGLETVRLLDPTCGSGHFLIGAFGHLFEARQRQAPGLPVKGHAERALGQVYGVDINPYAAAIARFRLILAYLEAAQIEKLKNAPRLAVNVLTADSLLYTAKGQTIEFASRAEDAAAWGDSHWQLDDPEEARRMFSRSYHAVVGNPPYITCKDPVLREKYRQAYASAAGKYALSAPFTERFFQLAAEDGFVGMINANSFMKREFGKKLIEEVLPKGELTRVIDTAGAYIPGHGTPTVLLFGRHRAPIADKITAVMGKRGEPETPADPQQGLVWSSIRDHFREVGFENDFISVAQVQRATFNKHPWSLGGGGAAELKELLEQRAHQRLGAVVESIGFMSISGEDEAYVASAAAFERHSLPHRPFGVGEVVRDWVACDGEHILFPYDSNWAPTLEARTGQWLWPYRATLRRRLMFGKTQEEAGFQWFEYRHVGRDKLRTDLCLAFPFVATHNHFALDRGGRVFKQTAPIIKLPEGATEDDHLALLAYLNSSTACFWLKQVFSPKGMHNGSESNATPFLVRFEFDGTKLKTLPVPAFDQPVREKLIELGRALDKLARERGEFTFQDSVESDQSRGIQSAMDNAVAMRHRIRDQMIALQENVDWVVYAAFGLVDETLPAGLRVDSLRPGARAFEIYLARLPDGDRRREWFRWNEVEPQPTAGTPFVDLAVERINSDPRLQFLESPECKRRWIQPSGKAAQELQSDKKVLTDECDEWLASMLEKAVEKAALSSVTTMRQVVDSLAAHKRFVEVIRWRYPDGDVAQEIARLMVLESVPFLSVRRYSASGLAKRAIWETVWDLQRREDGGAVVEVPVSPKYEPADFSESSYFRVRGKLDVPRERFISYPGAEKDEDPSPLYGWAGWDDLQRATALARLYHERKTEDGWPVERLVPLLAGLLELVPWLKQWNNDPTDDLGGEGAGDWYERYVEAEARSLGKGLQDLRDWRPEKGRRK